MTRVVTTKKCKYHSPTVNTDPPPPDLPVPATSRDKRLPGYRNLLMLVRSHSKIKGVANSRQNMPLTLLLAASKKVARKAAPNKMATNDTQADSSLSDADDDEICVYLMTMVHAHDFSGLLAAVRNNRYLAKAELMWPGTRLIHQVASIIPTGNERIKYCKLLHTLVGGRKVKNWQAENLMANDCFNQKALHFAAAAGNCVAINILICAYIKMLD